MTMNAHKQAPKCLLSHLEKPLGHFNKAMKIIIEIVRGHKA